MYPECEESSINRETNGPTLDTPVQSQRESRAVTSMKESIAELEKICKECKEKNCSIYCETKRRIDCYKDMLADKGRHSPRW